MDLKLTCPHCKRSCGSAALMRSATIVVKRTCRKCRTRWSVTLRPIGSRPGVTITEASWLSLGVAAA